MNLYKLLVFFHVLGAVGVFVALGIEAVALARLRWAGSPASSRTWLQVIAGAGRMAPITMLTLLGSGIWMTIRWWGPQPWILTAFAGVVAMGVLGGGVSRRHLERLRAELANASGPELSSAARSLQSSRWLTASLRLRLALGTGILGLMTIQPGPSGSLVILAVALAAGLVAAFTPATAAAREGRPGPAFAPRPADGR